MVLTRVEAERLNKAVEQVAKLEATKLAFEDPKTLSFMIAHAGSFVKGVLKHFGLLKDIEGEDSDASLEFDSETLGRFSLSCIMYGLAIGRCYEALPESDSGLTLYSMADAYEHHKKQNGDA